MNTRLQRIRKEILAIGMAFVMIAVSSIFPSQHMPVVRAEGEGVVLQLSSLQYDGSRYYFVAYLVVEGYLGVAAQIFVNSATDQVANEIRDAGITVDTSVFPEFFIGCGGFNDCDYRCNQCVQNYISLCKAAAIAGALLAGAGITQFCWGCIFSTGAITPASLACTIGCAVLYVGAAAAAIAGYYICKYAAPGTCTDNNPGCICKMN
jgi:hypothetical protein